MYKKVYHRPAKKHPVARSSFSSFSFFSSRPSSRRTNAAHSLSSISGSAAPARDEGEKSAQHASPAGHQSLDNRTKVDRKVAKAKTTITLKELKDAEKAAARRRDYATARHLQVQHKKVTELEQAEHDAAAVGDYDTAEALGKQSNKLMQDLSSNHTLKRYYVLQTG